LHENLFEGFQSWWQEYGVTSKNSDTGKSIHLSSTGQIVWCGSVFTQNESSFDSFLRMYNAIPDGEITSGAAQGDQVGDPNFFAVDIQPLSTGFGIIGKKTNITADTSSLFLVRAQENGIFHVNSAIEYTEFGFTEGNSLFDTSDGGIILLGTRVTPLGDEIGKGGTDFFLVKTDGFGNVQWFKAIGGEGDERGGQVRQASDGGYVFFGTSDFQGLPRMTLVKTNKNGDIN